MGHFFPPPPQPIVSQTGAQPYAPNKLPPSLETVPNPPFAQSGRTQQVIFENAAIAQPDPWVYAFEGKQAGQPYGPARLPPATLIVPNPPFVHAGRSTAAGAWQAAAFDRIDPWPYVYLDPTTGAQPYGPPTNTPPATAVVVTQTPYINQWMASVLKSWVAPDPPPTLLGKLSPGIPGQSVDNPPPNAARWQSPVYPSALLLIEGIEGVPPAGQVVTSQNPYENFWLSSVIQSWISPDPFPLIPRYLNPTVTAVPVNNPPFTGRTALPNILAGWQPPDPTPTISGKLSPGIPGQSVDRPPSFTRPPLWVDRTDSYTPQQLRFFTQGAAVSTQGPYNNIWFATAFQSWLPADPQPTLGTKLPPSTLVVPNPPFNQRVFFPPYPEAAVAPQRPVYLPQGAAVVVSSYGPYNNTWLATVLESWQPADPPPTLPRTTAAPPGWSVDNPPGIEAQLVISWLPPDAQPQLPSYVIQPFIPPVPQTPYANLWLSGVVESWFPPDPAPTLPRNLPPSVAAVPVNNPPFSHYGRSAWVAEIAVLAWQPPDPLPTLGGKLNPSITAVPVNNPPFSGRTELPGILAQWAAWPPSLFPTPYGAPPQVQPGPPPPPVTAEFTVSGPDVSVYLQEFSYDVVYIDAPITKRTV